VRGERLFSLLTQLCCQVASTISTLLSPALAAKLVEGARKEVSGGE